MKQKSFLKIIQMKLLICLRVSCPTEVYLTSDVGHDWLGMLGRYLKHKETPALFDEWVANYYSNLPLLESAHMTVALSRDHGIH